MLEADLSSSMSTNKLERSLEKRYINVGIGSRNGRSCVSRLFPFLALSHIYILDHLVTRRVFDQVFFLRYSQLSATIIGSDAGALLR